MQTRIRKKLSDRNSASTKVEQTQSQPQSRSFGDSSQSTEEVSPTSSEKSIGYNFGQIEVQPATPRVIQPKPIIGGSSSRTEGGDRVSKQPLKQTKATPQITSIQEQLIQRQSEIETWDSYANQGKGAFVNSTIPTKDYINIVTSGNVNDKYKSYTANPIYKYKEQYIGKFENKEKIPDGRFFKEVNLEQKPKLDPNEFIIANGQISWSVLENYSQKATINDVARLDPKSDVVKNILKYPLQQSWHIAKKKLAQAEGSKTEVEVKQALMNKLWEFRQWHYNEILTKTQQEVGKIGLEKWLSAGSTTLTSDIDVNLKGRQTEYAVQVFNRLFKEDGWKNEPGVVYDVNAYALDFMHGGAIKLDDDRVVAGKEGKREDLRQGGFQKDSSSAKKDQQMQDEWSLVKLRIYMNPNEWEKYKKDTLLDSQIATNVEKKYQDYVQTLKTAMSQRVPGVKASEKPNKASTKSGIGIINSESEQLAKAYQDPVALKPFIYAVEDCDRKMELLRASALKRREKSNISGSKSQTTKERLLAKIPEQKEVLAEDFKMSASNRIYEEKLKLIQYERGELQKKIDTYDNLLKSRSSDSNKNTDSEIKKQNEEIENALVKLRNLISESALYANEAYVTDAAVNHAVVGLQMGQPIQQTAEELINAVTENLADSLKEISRHGSTLGEAAYKAGKYYMRMTDAAIKIEEKMNLTPNPKVKKLYEAGHKISVDIKKNDQLDEESKEKESDKEIKQYLGIADTNGLKNEIILVGIEVQQSFNKSKNKAQAL